MAPSSTKVLTLCKAGGLGGMEIMVARLCGGLPAHGIDVRLVVPSPSISPETPPELPSWFRARGVAAESSPALTAFSQANVRAMLRLAKLIRASDASVVNIHPGGCSLDPLDVLAVLLAGRKRCVLSPHNAESPRNFVYAAGKRLTSLFCDAIVVGCHALAEIYIRAGISRSKIHLIYAGVPAPSLFLSRGEARQQLDIPRDAFVVACVARLINEKGVDLVINALAQVADSGRPIRLVVAGEGVERAALEGLAKSLLNGRARFVGFLDDPSLAYAAADVLALATRVEACPNVSKEAGHFCVPTIVTDVGGVRDVVIDGETGLVVPRDNMNAFARALQLLANDDRLCRRLGENAKRHVTANFSESAMIRSYAEVLRANGVPRKRTGRGP
jgi:glycosyltransferase involved in cell wall biosynthesis